MKVTERSCDVTPRSKYQKSKGHPWSPCASNLVQFRLLFTKLRHFEKNGTHHFSLIGRHLESVSRTIPVFKHTLAPSEKWPTQEISVRFGPFFYRVIVLKGIATSISPDRTRLISILLSNSRLPGHLSPDLWHSMLIILILLIHATTRQQ